MSKVFRYRLTAAAILFIGIMAGAYAWPVGCDYVLQNSAQSVQERWCHFKLGLDLQGGAHLVYEADLSSISPGEERSAMEGVRDVIERRVNLFGVSEPVVQIDQVEEHYRLIVELAGVEDLNEAIRQIGETPQLDFRELASGENYGNTQTTSTTSTLTFMPTGLDGRMLKGAQLSFDPNTGMPEVELTFTSEGQKLFAEITRRNVGRPIAIFLDGQPISTPVVRQEILQGRAVISGNFTYNEAKELAQRLNAGALPVPIKLIAQQRIGASLGQESLESSLRAGLLGLLAVSLFLILFYRLSGLIAVLALLLYGAVLLSIFKLVPVTLTLAGIAGFVLSLGMAVDANVLMFERIKEELRMGKNIRDAFSDGITRAWQAIRDGNVSTLLTALILYWIGVGFVQGFALTLGIGILASMFTAFFFTYRLLIGLSSFKIPIKVWLGK